MWRRHASIRPSVGRPRRDFDGRKMPFTPPRVKYTLLSYRYRPLEFHSILAEDLIHYKNHSINKPSTNSDARFFQGIFSARARPSSPTWMTRHSSPFSKYPRKEGEGEAAHGHRKGEGSRKTVSAASRRAFRTCFGNFHLKVRPSSQVRAICKWFDGGGGASLSRPRIFV